jgi:hypothetical protein
LFTVVDDPAGDVMVRKTSTATSPLPANPPWPHGTVGFVTVAFVPEEMIWPVALTSLKT